MFNFIFQNPVKIVFGKGQIAAIACEVPQGARVLVTYGGGSVEKNGTLAQVRNALKGRAIVEFGGIGPNPTYETLMKAVELGRKEKIDFALAVGGGSVIDGTKFIVAAIPFDGEPWDILSKAASIKMALPFGTVLTLPATGSEMNCGAVISRKETKDKLVFLDPKVFPLFSVLDPTTTYSLPPRQVTNGIVDSFVHVMEQYLTFPAHAPLQDRFAESILQTLIEVGPKTLANPQDYDARSSLIWCATMALNGLIGQGVPQDWSTHMIGHELTALYGLDHGQTLAMLLPANMRVRQKAKHAKLLQYAHRVWNVHESSERNMIDEAIKQTAAFFEAIGAPTTMKDHGLTCDVEGVLAQLKRHNLTALGERRDVMPDVFRQILELI